MKKRCKRWRCTHTHTHYNLINNVGAGLVPALFKASHALNIDIEAD